MHSQVPTSSSGSWEPWRALSRGNMTTTGEDRKVTMGPGWKRQGRGCGDNLVRDLRAWCREVTVGGK